MKVAVAAIGRDAKSQISPRPGRARFYLIFGEGGGLVEVVANPFSRGGGGAGFAVAKMLADRGVGVVVGGRFGENMRDALRERGLEYREMAGSALEAMAEILRGPEG
ncbi:MAG: hypothetical protein JRH07_10320 [Deltaproteobacteria bacterium]|nr:hypothetical protein [Deltaproteobacteria bacterium]MBW2122226.1 hypothetical protein [Deltaproteobacteria bacterium]